MVVHHFLQFANLGFQKISVLLDTYKMLQYAMLHLSGLLVKTRNTSMDVLASHDSKFAIQFRMDMGMHTNEQPQDKTARQSHKNCYLLVLSIDPKFCCNMDQIKHITLSTI